jgi:hypothetical protein
VRSERVFSPITGDSMVRWTGEDQTGDVEYRVPTEPTTLLRRPRAYWVPAAWPEVIERLRRHGLRLEPLTESLTLELVMDRLSDVTLDGRTYEGHVRVSASPLPERRAYTLSPGSVRVPTDQPLGTLAVLLLDPRGPDSFFQWGFFPECLQRAEYFEDYVLEPMARRMMEEDPALAEAFRRRLAEDPDFAADPRARLEWFYRKTPYYDPRHLLYPVGREP